VTHWAVAVDLEQVRLLARLRRMPGLTVCQTDDALWLRGDIQEGEVAPQVATIPGARCFDLLPDKQLRPLGRLVPEGHLPEGHWQPLSAWLKVELPHMKTDARTDLPPVRLRVVRSGVFREPAMLETSLEKLAEYFDSAPEWRIQRWQLALALAENQTEPSILVRGQPLPPLPGQHWTEHEGICTPAGFAWEPAVDAAVVKELLGLAKDQIALLHPNGTHETIMVDDWVRANRSAVRQMQGARK